MEGIQIPLQNGRLRERYQKLVMPQMHTATSVAAGPTAVHDHASALAATQAAWQFIDQRSNLVLNGAPRTGNPH